MTEDALMNSFWHWFVLLVTVIGLLWCYAILKLNATAGTAEQDSEETHTWDENLTEYNNPLPKWWYNMFLLSIIFGGIYLILYPGLGNYKGVFGWSSEGQYDKEVETAEAAFGPIYEKYASVSVEDLAKDEEALSTGRRLYSTYCTTCHGSDARGATGFPNLRDDEWLFGGTPDMIKASIANGRTGTMPPWGAAMSEDEQKAMVEYVQSLSTGEGEADKIELGKQKYAMFCIACHGPEGKGNPALGAPDLSNDIWLYGGSDRLLLKSIRDGRVGVMPAHGEFLGEDKVHLLTAYVYSLSQK